MMDASIVGKLFYLFAFCSMRILEGPEVEVEAIDAEAEVKIDPAEGDFLQQSCWRGGGAVAHTGFHDFSQLLRVKYIGERFDCGLQLLRSAGR